jgi:hypothetical protein
MIQITCKRSGLIFEAENRRRSVHPKISYYTSHSDLEIRYSAIPVIERGKAEGWGTIERFIEEIERASAESEPKDSIECDWDGAWMARLTGSCRLYRFDRTFIDPVREEERGRIGHRFTRKYYCLSQLPDGIYEGCYKSGRGNETRTYWSMASGVRTPMSLAEVEAIYPAIEEPACQWSIGVGSIAPMAEPPAIGALIKRGGTWHEVRSITPISRDEDGAEVDPGDHAEICSTTFSVSLSPVSLSQVADWYRSGRSVDPDAVLDATTAGYLTTSEAMNSDF